MVSIWNVESIPLRSAMPINCWKHFSLSQGGRTTRPIGATRHKSWFVNCEHSCKTTACVIPKALPVCGAVSQPNYHDHYKLELSLKLKYQIQIPVVSLCLRGRGQLDQHFAGSVPQQGHSESSDGGCGGSGRSVCVFLSIDNMFSKVHAVSRPAGYMCIEHTLEIETAGRFYFNCPAGVPYGTTLKCTSHGRWSAHGTPKLL